MSDDLALIWKRSGRAEKILFSSMVIYSVSALVLFLRATYSAEYLSGLAWVAQFLTVPIVFFSFLTRWLLNRFEKKNLFPWWGVLALSCYIIGTIEPFVLIVNANVGTVEAVTLPVKLISKDTRTSHKNSIKSHLGTFESLENGKKYEVYISKKLYDEGQIGKPYQLNLKIGSLGIYYQDDSIRGDRVVHE